MEFKPLNDRLLVEEIYADDITPSGIIIPEQAKEKPQQGRVVAVGDGGYLKDGAFRKTQVKVGDLVLFGKFAGSSIKMNGKTYLIVMEEDLFGRFDEAA